MHVVAAWIRILAPVTKENVTWNKKLHIKMFKTALFDCAINEKCFIVDGGPGICPLFSSPPRGIWQLRSPQPREFAIQGKKKKNVMTGEGYGRSRNWLMHYHHPLSKTLKSVLAQVYATRTAGRNSDQTRGGTLGISGWWCAAGTLETLTYIRAISAEFC